MPFKPDITRDYYADLELTPGASIMDIKNAYKTLAFKYHPDRNHGQESTVLQRFQELTVAHEILTDSVTKYKYDTDRASTGYSCAGPRNNSRSPSQDPPDSPFSPPPSPSAPPRPETHLTVMRRVIEALKIQNWKPYLRPGEYKLLGIEIGQSTSIKQPDLDARINVYELFLTPGNREGKKRNSGIRASNKGSGMSEWSTKTAGELLGYIQSLGQFYWCENPDAVSLLGKEDPYLLEYKIRTLWWDRIVSQPVHSAFVIGPLGVNIGHMLAIFPIPWPQTDLNNADFLGLEMTYLEFFALFALVMWEWREVSKGKQDFITARVFSVKGKYVRRVKMMASRDWLFHHDERIEEAVEGVCKVEIGAWEDWESADGKREVVGCVFEEIEGFDVEPVGAEAGENGGAVGDRNGSVSVNAESAKAEADKEEPSIENADAGARKRKLGDENEEPPRKSRYQRG